MKRLFLGFLVLALGAAAPAPRDWRSAVTESAAGWTFGKPTAPLLVEYGSLGCPHCGHFAAETGSTIDGLVKAGKIRFSFRPFLIFPEDRAGFVLARCAPSSRRLAFIEGVYAAQRDSKAKLAAADADEAVRGKLYAAELAGPAPHALAIADVSGLKRLAENYGLAAADADRCLAEDKHHDWVTNANLTSRTSGIRGTPTYLWKEQRLPEDLTPERLLAALPK